MVTLVELENGIVVDWNFNPHKIHFQITEIRILKPFPPSPQDIINNDLWYLSIDFNIPMCAFSTFTQPVNHINLAEQFSEFLIMKLKNVFGLLGETWLNKLKNNFLNRLLDEKYINRHEQTYRYVFILDNTVKISFDPYYKWATHKE